MNQLLLQSEAVIRLGQVFLLDQFFSVVLCVSGISEKVLDGFMKSS